MNAKTYCLITGTLFAVGALTHLCRLVVGWPIVLGHWQAPLSISVLGVVVGSLLSGWAFKLAGETKS